jgi:hypothetical protein
MTALRSRRATPTGAATGAIIARSSLTGAAGDRKLFAIEAKLRELLPQSARASAAHERAEVLLIAYKSDPKLKASVVRAEAKWQALLDKQAALCDDASHIKATTLEGIKCKARLLDAEPEMRDLADSLVEDILALRGSAS